MAITDVLATWEKSLDQAIDSTPPPPSDDTAAWVPPSGYSSNESPPDDTSYYNTQVSPRGYGFGEESPAYQSWRQQEGREQAEPPPIPTPFSDYLDVRQPDWRSPVEAAPEPQAPQQQFRLGGFLQPLQDIIDIPAEWEAGRGPEPLRTFWNNLESGAIEGAANLIGQERLEDVLGALEWYGKNVGDPQAGFVREYAPFLPGFSYQLAQRATAGDWPEPLPLDPREWPEAWQRLGEEHRRWQAPTPLAKFALEAVSDVTNLIPVEMLAGRALRAAPNIARRAGEVLAEPLAEEALRRSPGMVEWNPRLNEPAAAPDLEALAQQVAAKGEELRAASRAEVNFGGMEPWQRDQAIKEWTERTGAIEQEYTALKQQLAEAQARPVEAPATAEAPPSPTQEWLASRPVGKAVEASGPDPNDVYQFRYRVVSLDEPIVSHLDNLDPNPAFPHETLQPRDRKRRASNEQIQKIVDEFVPSSLTRDIWQLDKGPMIIGPDGLMESGNGRTMALRRMREQQPEKLAAYKQELAATLPEYGLDASALAGVKDPILVRERVTELSPEQRQEFVRKANEPGTMVMSAPEVARADADRLTDDMLATLATPETTTAEAALNAAANRPLVQRFVAAVPANERGSLVDAEGGLSAPGLTRFILALFRKTYPGEAGSVLANTFIDSIDPGIKNVESGVFGSLPAMARAEALVRLGKRDRGLSLAEDLTKAVNVLARLKEQSIFVRDYVSTAAMFERELSPLQEQILVYLDDNNRAPKRIREFLNDYAALVERSPDTTQGAMMDIARPTKEALLEQVIARHSAEDARAAPLFAHAAAAAKTAAPGAEGARLVSRGAGDAGAATGEVSPPTALVGEVISPERVPETTWPGSSRQEERLRQLGYSATIDAETGEPIIVNLRTKQLLDYDDIRRLPTEEQVLVSEIVGQRFPEWQANWRDAEKYDPVPEETIEGTAIDVTAPRLAAPPEPPAVNTATDVRQAFGELGGGMGRTIREADLAAAEKKMDAARKANLNVTDEQAAATDLGKQIQQYRDELEAMRQSAAAPAATATPIVEPTALRPTRLADDPAATARLAEAAESGELSPDLRETVQRAVDWELEQGSTRPPLELLEEAIGREQMLEAMGRTPADAAATPLSLADSVWLTQDEFAANADVRVTRDKRTKEWTVELPSGEKVEGLVGRSKDQVRKKVHADQVRAAVQRSLSQPDNADLRLGVPDSVLDATPEYRTMADSLREVERLVREDGARVDSQTAAPPAPLEGDRVRFRAGLAGNRVEVPVKLGTRVGRALTTLNEWLFNQDAWKAALQAEAEGIRKAALPAEKRITNLARLDRAAFYSGDAAVTRELVPLLQQLPPELYDDAAAVMIVLDQADKIAAQQRLQAQEIAAAKKAGKPAPTFPNRQWSWGTDPARLQATINEIVNGVDPARLPVLLQEMEQRLGPAVFSRIDQASLQRLTQGVGQQRFDRIMRVLDGFYAHRNNLLEMQRRTGVIAPEEFDVFTKEFPHYAPIRVTKYLESKQQQPPRADISLKDNLLRHLTAEGTESAQLDPFLAYADLTRMVYRMTARNRLAQATADLGNIPGMDKFVRPLKAGESPSKGEVSFDALEAGERKTYVVAKEYAHAAAWDPTALPPIVLAIGRAITAPLRWGATAVNILFIPKNMIGDLEDAFIRAGLTPNEYRQAVADIWGDQALTQTYLQSGGGMGGAAMHGGQPVAGESKAFQRLALRASNKQQLARIVKDIVTLQPIQEMGQRVELGPRVGVFYKNLSQEQRARIKFDERLRRHNLALVGEDDAAKRATLVANFQAKLTPQEQQWLAAGRLSPLDVPVQATVGGRTVTIDFLTGGVVPLFANHFITFFNVGFQGVAQTARTFTAESGKRGAIMRLATIIGAPLVLAEVWNSMFPEQEDVPQYVKNRSLLLALPSPGKDRFGNAIPAYIEIPLRGWAPLAMGIKESMRAWRRSDPVGWGQLAASVMEPITPGRWQQQAMQTEWGWAHSQSPDAKEAAWGLMQSWSPVQGQSGADVLMGLAPTAVAAVLENAINWDTYRGRKIVPAEREFLPAAEQYGTSTARAAIAIGKHLGWSPAKIEHLVVGTFGGVGKQALEAMGIAMDTAGLIAKPNTAPKAGEAIYGWWVPKEGQPELLPAERVPELRAMAKAGEGSLYIVAGKDEDAARSKVYAREYVDTTGVDAPLTAIPGVGGLLGIVYRTQGGQKAETVAKAQRQELGEFTTEHTRRAWATLSPVLDEAQEDQAKLDADLKAGRKSVDEWKEGYRVIGERKRGAFQTAQAAFPLAAITGDRLAQYKDIADRVRLSAPTDKDRVEMLATAYLSMEPPEKADGSGEQDLGAFFAARKDYLQSLSPADRLAVQSEVRKNSTPLRQQYNEAQDLMQQYYDLPRYANTSYEHAEEVYAAGQKLRALEDALPTAVRNRSEQALAQLRETDPPSADLAREYLLARTQDSPRAAFWKENRAVLDKWYGSGTGVKGTVAAPVVTASQAKATSTTTPVSTATTAAAVAAVTPSATAGDGTLQLASTQYHELRNWLQEKSDEYYDAGDERTQEILDTYNPMSTEDRAAWRKANPAEYKQMQAYYTKRDKMLEQPENAVLAAYMQFMDSMGGRDTRQAIEKVTGKSPLDIFVGGLLSGDIKLEAAKPIQVQATTASSKPKTSSVSSATSSKAPTTSTSAARTSSSRTPSTTTKKATSSASKAKTPTKAKAPAAPKGTYATRWDYLLATGQARSSPRNRPASMPARATPIRREPAPRLELNQEPPARMPLTADEQWRQEFIRQYGQPPSEAEWLARFYAKHRRFPSREALALTS